MFLAIPASKHVVFERYSDSAGAYIALDSSNSAVYKQLYRAAKAKLKLRIKVSIIDTPLPKVEVSRPDLVAPDHLAAHCYYPLMNSGPFQLENLTSTGPLINNNPVMMAPVVSTPKPIQASREHLEQLYPKNLRYELLQKSHRCSIPNLQIPKASSEVKTDATTHANDEATRREIDDEAPVPRFFNAREHFYAELGEIVKDRVNSGRTGPDHSKPNCPNLDHPSPLSRANQPIPVPGTTFTICCNSCDDAIPDAHWHCSICDNGDFDLCSQCVDKGVICDNQDHWLIKRFVQNGKVINSITEKIAPKTIAKTNAETEKEIPGAVTPESKAEELEESADESRTCNSCVGGKARILCLY